MGSFSVDWTGPERQYVLKDLHEGDYCDLRVCPSFSHAHTCSLSLSAARGEHTHTHTHTHTQHRSVRVTSAGLDPSVSRSPESVSAPSCFTAVAHLFASVRVRGARVRGGEQGACDCLCASWGFGTCVCVCVCVCMYWGKVQMQIVARLQQTMVGVHTRFGNFPSSHHFSPYIPPTQAPPLLWARIA